MSYVLKMIMVMSAGSALLRFLPFLIFSRTRELPSFLISMSRNLPLAAMGMLVVYCLKDVSFSSGSHGFPEMIAILFIVISYRLKRNNLISIFGGTLLYLLLVNLILI